MVSFSNVMVATFELLHPWQCLLATPDTPHEHALVGSLSKLLEFEKSLLPTQFWRVLATESTPHTQSFLAWACLAPHSLRAALYTAWGWPEHRPD